MSKRRNPNRSIVHYQAPSGTDLWFTLQAIIFFIACMICSCCSLSSYAWGSLSPHITLPVPILDTRPTQTTTFATTGARPTESPTLVVTPVASSTPISAQHLTVTTASSLPTPTPVPSPTTQTTPASTQTQAPRPTDTGASASFETPSDLHIIHVEYNPSGLDDPDTSAEIEREHIVIENRGSGDQDMSGWTINNNRLDTYRFPDGFILRSGAIVQVWTMSGVDSSVMLYWESEEELWDNEQGVAYLRDHTETLMDSLAW